MAEKFHTVINVLQGDAKQQKWYHDNISDVGQYITANEGAF